MAWDRALETAFYPEVVAMVGVSANAKRGSAWSPGASSFINCYEELGFKGRIYPVNPKADEIMGYRAYPKVSDIPEPVDLVIVSVPAAALVDVLEDCIKADAKNIHVFTSGFEETGEKEAVALGLKVRETAARGGLRIIGPNCMGLYVPEAGIGPFDKLPRESGPVAFISQSGGHCNWFAHSTTNYGFYCSKVISFGNAYVMDGTDFLEYLAGDPKTGVVCMYLEGIKDGARLTRLVKEVNRIKPVILWKAGLTESGTRAVASHTGSLAGQDAIWKSFYAQTGAVQVYSLEELAEMAMTFLQVKPPEGKRVALLGLGGGSSVSSADTCGRAGLDVPHLCEETQSELKKFISLAGASVKNPLDTGLIFRDTSLLKRELNIVAADPNIDMLIVSPHLDMALRAGTDQVDRLVEFLSNFTRNNSYGKPAVLTFHSFSNDPQETELRSKVKIELVQRGVPVYDSLIAASRALARLYQYHRFQRIQTAGSDS
jgi:acyl-CoA synthetase (NDP forming)